MFLKYSAYFPDVESCVAAIRYMKENNPHVAFVSDKSLTYVASDGTKIQFIYYAFYPEAKDIFQHFDFSVNCCAYDCRTDELVFHENFWMHNSQRFLSINPKTKFPILSVLRLDKYKSRGYKTSRNEVLKLCLAVANLNIDSWDKFKEQIGNSYGFTLADLRDCEKEEFSMEKAMERLQAVAVEDGQIPMQEHHLYPYNAVDFMLLGKPVEYTVANGKTTYLDPAAEEVTDGVEELIERGLLEAVEVPKGKFLSQKFYAFVSEDKVEGTQITSKWGSGTVHSIDNLYAGMYCPNVVAEVSFKEEDVTSISRGNVGVMCYTIEKLICNKKDVLMFKAGKEVEYKRPAKKANKKGSYRGGLKQSSETFVARFKKDFIKDHISVTGGKSKYAHNTFSGHLLEGGENITAYEILCVMDDFNLCFGGECTLTNNGKFQGRYSTD